jgi:hypothetical protein
VTSFAITKPVDSERSLWLTRSFPFVTWGPRPRAQRYLTESEAWQAIGHLPRQEGDGALVIVLE